MARPGRRRGNQKLSPAAIALREREAKAVELRCSGLSWPAIAQELGWADASGPWRAVERLLAELPVENVDLLRAIEGARLTELFRVVGGIASAPDQPAAVRLKALTELRRISESRRRLLGLDLAAATGPAGFAGPVVEMRSPAADELVRDDPERLFLLISAFERAGLLAELPEPDAIDVEVREVPDGNGQVPT